MDTKNIQDYVGKNIASILDGYRKQVYEHNWNQLYINYGNNVEFQRLARQVMLCSETEEYIYAFPGKVKYLKGTRPLLEKKVDEICKGCKSDREKVIALMCFTRDLFKANEKQIFYGGTEEDLIKKGEWLCECLARLMVALCEVIDIPGRIVLHICAGHLTSELYFEGKWCYVDPRIGLFYLDSKGQFASVRELIKDRSIIYSQNDDVKAYISPLWSYEYCTARNYNKYLNPKEIQCFGDYSLADGDMYNFEWKSLERADNDGLQISKARYTELTELIFGELSTIDI